MLSAVVYAAMYRTLHIEAIPASAALPLVDSPESSHPQEVAVHPTPPVRGLLCSILPRITRPLDHCRTTTAAPSPLPGRTQSSGARLPSSAVASQSLLNRAPSLLPPAYPRLKTARNIAHPSFSAVTRCLLGLWSRLLPPLNNIAPGM
jgi:hypothetical protein